MKEESSRRRMGFIDRRVFLDQAFETSITSVNDPDQQKRNDKGGRGGGAFGLIFAVRTNVKLSISIMAFPFPSINLSFPPSSSTLSPTLQNNRKNNSTVFGLSSDRNGPVSCVRLPPGLTDSTSWFKFRNPLPPRREPFSNPAPL